MFLRHLDIRQCRTVVSERGETKRLQEFPVCKEKNPARAISPPKLRRYSEKPKQCEFASRGQDKREWHRERIPEVWREFSSSHQLSTDQCVCMKKSPKAEKRSPPGAGNNLCSQQPEWNPLSDGEHKRVLSQFFYFFLVTQSCLTLCDPMDYTSHGILQARILEGVAVPFSRGSYQPRDWTLVSCIAGGFFTSWDTREEE